MKHSRLVKNTLPAILLPFIVVALEGEWPELEKAEKLARGAALKWASGVFYQPDKLDSLPQYKIREMQRNRFIESRLKVGKRHGVIS